MNARDRPHLAATHLQPTFSPPPNPKYVDDTLSFNTVTFLQQHVQHLYIQPFLNTWAAALHTSSILSDAYQPAARA